MTTTPPALDLAGLDGGVGPRAMRAYYRRASIPVGRRWWPVATMLVVMMVVEFAIIALLLRELQVTGLDLALWGALLLVVTGAYFALLLALSRRRVTRLARVERAAAANAMVFHDREAAGRGLATEVVATPPTSVSPVPWTAGTQQLTRGWGARRFGYLRVPLEAAVPHIALENRRSRVLRSTGRVYRRAQRLGLEGDFDRTFSLHCPQGYERDALYIFTPDLMAMLLDVAADCEVELKDDWMSLYIGRPWQLWRPARFARAHAVAQVLGAKARRRTARYRDDRADDATSAGLDARDEPLWRASVAQEGQRLRTRASVSATIGALLPLVLGVAGAIALLTGAV